MEETLSVIFIIGFMVIILWLLLDGFSFFEPCIKRNIKKDV